MVLIIKAYLTPANYNTKINGVNYGEEIRLLETKTEQTRISFFRRFQSFTIVILSRTQFKVSYDFVQISNSFIRILDSFHAHLSGFHVHLYEFHTRLVGFHTLFSGFQTCFFGFSDSLIWVSEGQRCECLRVFR